ncbi:hypothetical protein [Planctobacterium marinum]|uniref:SnoaL-like domain-containing protein n=1 Tax=Planctobacterium marinum TaxID=1631968 RepID=A0AA48KSS9_9ALTE|nr:hypothetical protein MACH26_29930 [Planctobacterium marinum]
MSSLSQLFFDDYARAYEQYDARAVADMYFVPAVIMSDERKNVYTTPEAIAEVIDDLMDRLQSIGAALCEAEVCQTMRLSENIMFSNVKWTFKNVQEQKLFSCFVSYTLQSEGESLKIIVSVIDDEERELERLLFTTA